MCKNAESEEHEQNIAENDNAVRFRIAERGEEIADRKHEHIEQIHVFE